MEVLTSGFISAYLLWFATNFEQCPPKSTLSACPDAMMTCIHFLSLHTFPFVTKFSRSWGSLKCISEEVFSLISHDTMMYPTNAGHADVSELGVPCQQSLGSSCSCRFPVELSPLILFLSTLHFSLGCQEEWNYHFCRFFSLLCELVNWLTIVTWKSLNYVL